METWEKFVTEWERIIDIWRTIPRSFQQRLKAVRESWPLNTLQHWKEQKSQTFRRKLKEEGEELRKLLDRETYALEVSFQPCHLLFSCEYNFYLVYHPSYLCAWVSFTYHQESVQCGPTAGMILLCFTSRVNLFVLGNMNPDLFRMALASNIQI